MATTMMSTATTAAASNNTVDGFLEDVEEGRQQDEPLLGNDRRRQQHRPVMTFTYWQFSNLEVPGSNETAMCVSRHYRCRNVAIIVGIEFAVLLPWAMLLSLLGNTIQPFAAVIFWMVPFTLIFCQWYRNKRYFYKYGVVKYIERVKHNVEWCGFKGNIFDLRLGYYHELRSEYSEAISCYHRFLEEYPFIRNEPGGIVVLKALGRVYYSLGRYEKAFEYHTKAVQLRRLKDVPSRPSQCQQDYHILGQTLRALGKYSEALGSYQEAVNLLKQRGYDQTIDIAKSYVKIGEVYQLMIGGERNNNIDNAIQAYHQALEIYLLNVGEFPRTSSIAKIYAQLGDLYLGRKKKKIRTASSSKNAQAHREQNPANQDNNEDDTTMIENHWNAAIEVYRRGGKTDEDREIIQLQSKISDLRI